MASRWNAMEFHGMPWTLCYLHGILVELYGIQMECHGIPWDTEDRIILAVEIHGIWYSDKMSEWKKKQNGCQQKIQEIFLISGGHHLSWPRLLN